MRKITNDQLQNIISLLQTGKSNRQVASETQLSHTIINRIARKHVTDREKNKGGRPELLNKTEKRYCVQQINRGGQENAVQVAKVLENDIQKRVSPQTVRRALKLSGLDSIEKQKKPMLRKANVVSRLNWAKAHRNWTINDWRRVVWSDETKINRFNSDGRTWAWIRDNEEIQPRHVKQTVKHGGGSIMIWSCISASGVGWMCKIEGTMNKELYLEILRDELDKSVDDISQKLSLNRSQVIFQQDNDPKHSSKQVQEYLQQQDYDVMDWPSQSPDLNPIEHMWALLKRKLNDYPTAPKGINELFERVTDIWYNVITINDCLAVIDSMPSRCEAVIKSKGYWTKY